MTLPLLLQRGRGTNTWQAPSPQWLKGTCFQSNDSEGSELRRRREGGGRFLHFHVWRIKAFGNEKSTSKLLFAKLHRLILWAGCNVSICRTPKIFYFWQCDKELDLDFRRNKLKNLYWTVSYQTLSSCEVIKKVQLVQSYYISWWFWVDLKAFL